MMVKTVGDRIEVETLLPFYVNGTLDLLERARVRAALKIDGDLRMQVAALQRVHSKIHETDGEQSPGDFGLARLMRDIDREAQSNGFFQKQRVLVAASAFVAAVAIGSAVFMTGGDERFRQASGDTNLQRYTVAFQPDAPQQEVSQLLQEYRLEIVEGPSAIGLYRIDPGRNEDLEAVLSELRSRIDIVESIQLE